MAQIEHPTPATLRNLSTLCELPTDQIQSLAKRLQVHTASKGACLLSRGSEDPSLFYLLHGSIHLKAADGANKLITHEDPTARSPIARLRPARYDVVAASQVHYLRLDSELLEEVDSSLENSTSLLLDTYQVVEMETELEVENQLTLQIYQDLNSNQLLLPSLPDIAIRVGQAVNHDYADAAKVARVLENDPTIAAKILKVANSARYGGSQQIARLRDAVARIGLGTTHQLVVTFALRELFRCNSAVLNRRMQELWEHTRQVAAISHVLAAKCSSLDPETALLAGLVHDIGSVAVLGYARDFPEVVENPQELETSIRHLRGQLGNMILVKWHLPDYLAQVASDAEQWERDHSGVCDFTDLIIVAKLHTLISSKKPLSLPPIDQVPAYARLDFGENGPESSLHILEKARAEIHETLALLGH